jgi:hypothetical protein
VVQTAEQESASCDPRSPSHARSAAWERPGSDPSVAADSTGDEDSLDPAAERGADGRSRLQERLGLWGKIISLINIPYWFTWWFAYFGPSGDQDAALRIVPAAALGAVNYLALWVIGAGRPRSLRTLKVADVVAHALIGMAFCGGLRLHPVPAMMAVDSVA